MMSIASNYLNEWKFQPLLKGSGRGGRSGCYTVLRAADRGDVFPKPLPPRLFPPKRPKFWNAAWPTQVVDHLVPNQNSGFFLGKGKTEFGKRFGIKSLQKPFSAQIQRTLKMWRLPPTQLPTFLEFHGDLS